MNSFHHQLTDSDTDTNTNTNTNDQANEHRIIVPDKCNTVANTFEKNQLSWCISSQMPTDLSIRVQDMTFNAHKYPLASKCGYIGRIELQPSISNFGHELKLQDLPGGSEVFETILKFCYGLPIDLNPNNIAPLRCASEYLEMTEECEDGNLITKTESFLTFVVLASWKDTIIVLKSCENLSPWAENLQIVRRCCDSVAWNVSRQNSAGDADNDDGWWFNDVATLRIDHFMRIITSVRAKGKNPEIVAKCIMYYADKWLPSMDEQLEGLRGYGYGKNELQFSVLVGRMEEGSIRHKEQRAIVESLVSLLPSQNGAVSCKFLLKMLKRAMVYSASPALISDLEKRVGIMLADATVDDLLIPNYKTEDTRRVVNSAEQCTMHNIDVVLRILEFFLMHEQQQHQQKARETSVSKLLDNYLAEIAKDPNLSITKFQVLAESLPENARTCDDGLYRAIDTYLKTHPSLSDHERRRLCKIMNCEKLSLDACTHAAQNDRLPLRTIIQVLFSEQVKMRMAMQGKKPEPRDNISVQEENQSTTDMEIKTLKTELDNVKIKMTELQTDYSQLQLEYNRLSNNRKSASGWHLGWRRIKKSFHLKHEGDETEDGQKKTNTTSRRVSLGRRLSMS